MKMEKLFKKIMLSEKEYEYLTKGIVGGGGIATFIGLMFQEVIL